MDASAESLLLARERTRTSFSVPMLSAVLWGGAERLERLQGLMQAFLQDPVCASEERIHMNHAQNYLRGLAKTRRFFEKLFEMGVTEYDDMVWCYRAMGEVLPCDTHLSMFIPTLTTQTTDEQRGRWLPLAQHCAILGAYAQTELGHGSNVRGLETLAVYHPDTQEFDIHSPTISSMKWWPGGLGKTATHAVVFARLITLGKDHGVHGFIVPLRSLSDHALLPGVELGDIGPKVGFNAVDNGYARFTHVRVPRDHMLMRFAAVAPDGRYVPAQHSKAGYAPMVHVRALIVSGAAAALSRALTIAVRYSAVRRQGGAAPDGQEMQVLDYTSQQWVLLPLLATAYAMHFTGRAMQELYVRLQQGMKSGDLSLLPEVHATSAGLKALTTQTAADGIEACRKACGGHGYSHLSGLPELLFNYLASCTVEGTLEVLTQQTARALLKTLAQARAGTPPGPHCGYLGHHASPASLSCAALAPAALLTPEALVRAYEARALCQAVKVDADLQRIAAMEGPEKAWNACLVGLIQLSHAHCHAFLVRTFFAAVAAPALPPPARAVLARLARLHAVHGVVRDGGQFVAAGVLAAGQLGVFEDEARSLTKELRPDAVGLVDAWAWPDALLHSAIGSSDGDAYRRLYHTARDQEPLNASEVPAGYAEHIRPLLHAGTERVRAAARL